MVKGQLLTTVKMSPGFVAWERVQRKRNTAKKTKDEEMVEEEAMALSCRKRCRGHLGLYRRAA